MVEKMCKRCKRKKPLSEFGHLSKNKDGTNTICRECAQEIRLKSRNIHKDEINRRRRLDRLNNPEKYRNASRKWYDTHREEHITRVMRNHYKKS